MLPAFLIMPSQATMHLTRRSKIVSWDGIISRDDFNDHLMEMISDHLTETNSDETLNRTLKRWSMMISWRCCVSSPWDVSQTSHGDGRVFVSWDNIEIISRDFDVHLMDMMMKISRDDCVFVSWDDVGIISRDFDVHLMETMVKISRDDRVFVS